MKLSHFASIYDNLELIWWRAGEWTRRDGKMIFERNQIKGARKLLPGRRESVFGQNRQISLCV